MRKNGTLTFMLSDHLGSTSLTTDSAGNVISELRYTAWGEVRYQAGTTSTSYTYTGQYNNTADFGLMYYNARWYDSQLGRFTQPDTIIPGENISQSWDRFAYVGNNPVKNTDPDVHCYPLCTMAIGAAVGAIAGAAIYTYYNHGQDFSYTGFALSVGAGIIAGGLAGTGVGLVLEAGAAETAIANPELVDEIAQEAPEIVDDVAQKSLEIIDDTAEEAARIFRGGGTNPGNLTPRPSDNGTLSFRDSLSEPWPPGKNLIFKSSEYFSVDISKLPDGSVIFDNIPPGHVSVVNVAWEIIKAADIIKVNFPK